MKVRFLGMITSVRRITTKNNRTMAVMEVEDLTGSIEVVAFPDCYEQHTEVIREDAILDFDAKVDERGERQQLILDRATDDLPAPRQPVLALATVVIVLPSSSELWQDIEAMQAIDDVLKRHDGPHPVEVEVSTGVDVVRLRSRTRKVEWSTALARELEGILGEGGAYLDEAVIGAMDTLDPTRGRELQEVA